MAELGNVKIANEVVAIIAGIAATDIQGVFGMSGGITDGISTILGMKNFSKGVKVEVGEKECTIDVNIVVDYGTRIPEVSAKVQENVMKSVTNMTGLKVVEVNVFIQGINIPKIDTGKEEEEN